MPRGFRRTSPAGTAFHVPAPGSNMLTVRGPGDGTEGYCWLGATYAGTSSPFSSTLHGTLHGPTTSVSSDPATAEAQLEESRRRVSVEIAPAPHPLMTVTVDDSDGRGPQVEIRDMPLPQPVPASYKFGFAASTGGFTDVHLIRNVAVTPYADLPQLNLVKQLDEDYPLPNPITVGTALHYQFVVTNSGTVPLTGVHLDDPVVGPVSCPSSTLTPGQTQTCTGTYTVTGADVSRGYVHNVAIAAGSDDGATIRSPEAEFDVPIARSEVLELTKKVDDAQPYLPGETATYQYVVTNTSGQEVNDIVVHDDRLTGVTCESRSLTPAGTAGAATTCTGQYTVTPSDAGIGHVINTAHAVGVGADGTNVTSPPDTAEIVVAAAAPSLHLEKLVDDTHSYEPGAVVDYTYVVSNTGNVPINAISIADDHVTGITCETTSLARAGTPGDSTTCHGAYTVTADDVAAGHVINKAYATGTVAGHDVASEPAVAEIRVALPTTVLTITKTVDDSHPYEPGQVVTYQGKASQATSKEVA